MSLAFEPAESYLMRVPPRVTEGDLVVSRPQWLFRWLPYVLYSPIIIMSVLATGVWANTGFLEAADLIGTSRIKSLGAGEVACEFAGTLRSDGGMSEDMSPFHCRCMVRDGGMPWASANVVDQWGALVEPATLHQNFDQWSGDTGDLYKQANTPWKNGVADLLEPCKDHRGIERWCWKDHHAKLKWDERPVLPDGMHCAAYGAQIGQTMSYVVIHFGEILSLLSYRMDDFFLSHLFTNHVYTGFLVFNLAMLGMALYVPVVAGVLDLAPLTPARLALSICFAFLIVIANELAKINFRWQMERHNEVKRTEALELSLGGPPPGYRARKEEKDTFTQKLKDMTGAAS